MSFYKEITGREPVRIEFEEEIEKIKEYIREAKKRKETSIKIPEGSAHAMLWLEEEGFKITKGQYESDYKYFTVKGGFYWYIILI